MNKRLNAVLLFASLVGAHAADPTAAPQKPAASAPAVQESDPERLKYESFSYIYYFTFSFYL